MMIRTAALSLALTLALSLFAGCEIVAERTPPDQTITCGHFDDFLASCSGGCTVSWDCEHYYSTLPLDDQFALDDCSDCLADNLNAGVCADCHDDYVGSCQDFMTDLLGVDCW